MLELWRLTGFDVTRQIGSDREGAAAATITGKECELIFRRRCRTWATPTLRVADAQVHHGRRQVPGAAAAAQVGVAAAAVVGVEWRGQRRGEVQVAEVRQGAAGVEQALVVGQTRVLLRGRENTAAEGQGGSSHYFQGKTVDLLVCSQRDAKELLRMGFTIWSAAVKLRA